MYNTFTQIYPVNTLLNLYQTFPLSITLLIKHVSYFISGINVFSVTSDNNVVNVSTQYRDTPRKQ